MFQDMNVAKSVPFALLTIYQKIHVSPQSSLKPPVLANHVKFSDHFLIWTTRNGNLNFHSKLHEIHSIHQPPRRIKLNPRTPR